MQKFIPLNKNRNTHVVVTKYNWPIEEYLRGHAAVIHVNSLDDVVNIRRHADETLKVVAYVYTDPYASLETIEIPSECASAPLILRINRLGQFRAIHHKLNALRNMDVILFFTGNSHQSIVDAQIAASLGIHSGIMMMPDSELGDDILDLITYNAYSTMPHADIEPFSTMERYYDGESYVSPSMAYFNNPNRYIHVDSERHLAFTSEQLANGDYFDQGIEKVKTISQHEAVEKENNKWQQTFITPHPCSFCPAFRICVGYFEQQREKGRCKEVMSELLEAIEFQKKRNQQNNKKESCQL